MTDKDGASAGAKPRTDDERAAKPVFDTFSVLRRVCEIADDIDVYSARRPQDAPGASAKQRARRLTCPHNPSRVFPALNTVLLEDVTLFHGAFKAQVKALGEFTPPNKTCLGCATQTVAEFELLYLQFERFTRWIMAAAKKRDGAGPGA